MKDLTKHAFNATTCRKEWLEFDNLLKTKKTIDENKDVLPFFKTRHDLSSLISGYFPDIKTVDVLAHEYPIYGAFKADLVVGESSTHNYLLIEFEDGNPNSIFRTKKGKSTPEWATRFEGAFSQLIDWLWKLEDMRSTADFTHVFGSRHANFQGLIIIGKDMALGDQELSRLKWRTDRVIVDSKAISCVSFNDLCTDLDFWLNKYYGV
jgi:hypothetical protein